MNATGYRSVASGTSIYIADTGFITSGDFPVVSANFTQVGTDLTVTCDAGDYLMLKPQVLCSGSAGPDIGFDAATRVSSADKNFWSSEGAVAGWPGVLASWYVPGGVFLSPQAAMYKAQAGDIVNGQVTVRFYGRSTGANRTLNANANYKLRLRLINLGLG